MSEPNGDKICKKMFLSLSNPCVCVCCREEDESAMVFVSSELGEHSITTRDIDVNENTIIQFEVHKRSLDEFLFLYFLKTILTLIQDINQCSSAAPSTVGLWKDVVVAIETYCRAMTNPVFISCLTQHYILHRSNPVLSLLCPIQGKWWRVRGVGDGRGLGVPEQCELFYVEWLTAQKINEHWIKKNK